MPPRCWNEHMQSIPADRVVVQESPFRIDEMREDADLGPTYAYECKSSLYPYRNYNEAAAVYNKRELRRRYTHDTYPIRNYKMHEQTQRLADKHKIGIERVRLKEADTYTLNKSIYVLGIIYYVMVGLVGLRIFVGSNDYGSRVGLPALFLLLFFLVLPLLAGHVARGSYAGWNRLVPDKFKSLGIVPQIHPHPDAGEFVASPYMNAQKRAAYMHQNT